MTDNASLTPSTTEDLQRAFQRIQAVGLVRQLKRSQEKELLLICDHLFRRIAELEVYYEAMEQLACEEELPTDVAHYKLRAASQEQRDSFAAGEYDEWNVIRVDVVKVEWRYAIQDDVLCYQFSVENEHHTISDFIPCEIVRRLARLGYTVRDHVMFIASMIENPD